MMYKAYTFSHLADNEYLGETGVRPVSENARM